MLQNTKINITFTLDAYNKIHDLKCVFVVVLFLLYPVIVIANGLIICIVFLERKLHKPMYFFICNLACINLYGGSAVAPFIITRFLTEDYQITWLSCLVHTFVIYSYVSSDITNLTVMAYDRYISICYPLNYEKIVTPTKVIIAVAVTWLYPFVRITISLFLTAKLYICGAIIEKVYCDNYSVVKLACSDISSYNIYGTTMIFFAVVLPFIIIIYSYLRIILICLNLSKRKQDKLFSTCVPHLIAIFNFIIGSVFELLQGRFDMKHVPYTLRVILSLYFLILSPIINPVLYGMRTQAIKEAVMRKLCNKICQKQTAVNCES
ncbi:putative olfactory receptor 52D1-like [Triplophysa rosa]|uniref:Olfactory receptor n=1 Tax=Triplophysa rosa TaxID=992332 RepID=A0A9W7TQJ2_TRIRA|nr:putative olfactory receptor 52D1-like [Triplophysa rosa]